MPHIEITPAPVSSATPSGAAGGDLAGTFPNPTLKATGPGVTGPVGDAATVPIITIDAQGRVTALTSAASGSYGLGIYGDGSDGTVTFDGSTTILGMAPSSSIYTLTRDIWLAAGTINNGVTIITNGFRIFCLGTLTINGTVQWNGNASSTAAAGAALTSSTSTLQGLVTTFGTAGAAGAVGAGANAPSQTGNYGWGGLGGGGGQGGTGAGGAGGTQTAPPAKVSAPRQSVAAVGAPYYGGASGFAVYGGTGGGGGGGDGSNSGGGGGGGGGVVVILSKAIAGTGAIQARGGNGASMSAGNAGGGGGGGGGVVMVVSGSVSAGAITGQTIDANGGTKGTLHGTGFAAADGGAGKVFLIPDHQ